MEFRFSDGVVEGLLHLEAMEAGRSGKFKSIEDRDQRISLMRSLVSEMVLATLLREIRHLRENPSISNQP